IRKDQLRAPQASNTVYAIWRPPLGIFEHDGYLGAGAFKLCLTPNANYSVGAVETSWNYIHSASLICQVVCSYGKDQNPGRNSRSTFDGVPSSVQTVAADITSHCQSRHASTHHFIQDRLAGASALIPPS